MTPHTCCSADTGVEAQLAARRLELAGPHGLSGLLKNDKSTAIAVFASLGGLLYGFNQGLFGQILTMPSFTEASGVEGIVNPNLSALLTSILELGAWVGVLVNGYLVDRLGRKRCIIVACAVFSVGVSIQACTHHRNYAYILAGRAVTGLGVGALSMVGPLYNAELAPAEIRGSLVALQQLAIMGGIMISFWLTYATNFIGGTSEGQSKAAWLVPITIQILPALTLAFGVALILPESPRWLMSQGRQQEAVAVIAQLRRRPENDMLVRMETLELEAQKLFEDRLCRYDFPKLQNGSKASQWRLGVAQYKSLLTNPRNFRRTRVAGLTMVFQQLTGVNALLYCAPFIFRSIGLDSDATISLLASGVVGVVMFLATIPAVLYVDSWGRKPTLIWGGLAMGACHFCVTILVATFQADWGAHKVAGWVTCTFIWLFSGAFSASWGPCAWILVSEVFPLGLRGKGVSIGTSCNWLANFAVAMSTPSFLGASHTYGAFLFLGSMCLFGTAYVSRFVPETKQRTLDEIDELFGDDSGRSRREAQMLVQAQYDVGLLALAGIRYSPEDQLQRVGEVEEGPSHTHSDEANDKGGDATTIAVV
ncbi:Quinate permease [Thecaphora frezii]